MSEFGKRKLSEAKIAFIIAKLALKMPYYIIKSEYERDYQEKIETETIQEIESVFEKKIAAQSKKEMSNIKRRSLAHPAVRLDFMLQALLYAFKPRPIRSVKVSENDYEVYYDVDHQAIKGYLQLAQNEDYSSKKLLLDLIKNEVPSFNAEEGFETIEIEDGLIYKGGKLLNEEEILPGEKEEV